MMTNSTPARGAQLAERLISQDKVQYMLGPYSTGMTAAIAPVSEQYKIPMVEAEGAGRSLFNKGYKYMFAILSTSDQYLSSAIDLAAEMAKKNGKDPNDVKVAMAFESDPFSQDVRDRRDGRPRQVRHDRRSSTTSCRATSVDMAATLTKVKALKPDLLLVSGHEKGAETGRAPDQGDGRPRADDRHHALRVGRHHRQLPAGRRTASSARPNGRRR